MGSDVLFVCFIKKCFSFVVYPMYVFSFLSVKYCLNIQIHGDVSGQECVWERKQHMSETSSGQYNFK